MLLKNKIAIITGARRGIGKTIAFEMAKEGAKVVVTDLDKEDCQRVVEEIKNGGGEGIALKMDITDRKEIREALETVINKFGKIDILVNNAGILEQKPFETITKEEWQKMLKVNLEGAFLCSQEVVKCMKEQKSGRIINISSIGGQRGGNLAVHYAVSKAGIISLTRSLANIYSKDNILTNCIAPDLVLTEMSKKELDTEAGKEKLKNIPIGRAAKPREVANVVVFLASEKASYITGQTINVNGGTLFNT